VKDRYKEVNHTTKVEKGNGKVFKGVKRRAESWMAPLRCSTQRRQLREWRVKPSASVIGLACLVFSAPSCPKEQLETTIVHSLCCCGGCFVVSWQN
jgi:hypothetical protein